MIYCDDLQVFVSGGRAVSANAVRKIMKMK